MAHRPSARDCYHWPVPSLAEVPLKALYRVRAVNGNRAVRRRLMELGLVPGTPVRVIGVSPLGDPLQLEVRGGRLSIRKKEAWALEVDS